MRKIAFFIICAVAFGAFAACAPSSDKEAEVTAGDTTAVTVDSTEISSTVSETAAETEPVTTGAPVYTRIVCVGDSLTYGYGSTDPSKYSYPAVLGEILGSNYIITNCGVSQATAISKTGKYFNQNGIDYTTTTQYTRALKSKPNIVLIMLGTNDAKNVSEKVKAGITEFTDCLRAIGVSFAELATKPEIYILSAPYRTEDSSRKDHQEKAIIPAQKQLAEEMGWHYIDTYTLTKNFLEGTSGLQTDNLHFTDAGYRKLAEAIASELMK